MTRPESPACTKLNSYSYVGVYSQVFRRNQIHTLSVYVRSGRLEALLFEADIFLMASLSLPRVSTPVGAKLKICPTAQNDKKRYTSVFLPVYGTIYNNQEIRVHKTRVK